MARSDSNGSEPRRPITPTTDTPTPSTSQPFAPFSDYFDRFPGGDLIKDHLDNTIHYNGPLTNGIATPAAGYDDFSRFLQDWYQRLYDESGSKTEKRDIMNNFLDYIQLLQKNKFQTEQADLSYSRSTAANQVSLMMAAGMSRTQALAALQGGGESTPMDGGDPTQQANNSPNGAEIANSVFSGIDTVAGLGSLGLSAGMYGAEKGLKLATSKLYGLQYDDMKFKMDATKLGAKVFGCLQSLSINAVGGKTGTPLPKWNPDDDANLPNMIGFIQKGADAGDASCQAFIDSGYYQQLCENPYGPDIALGVLGRWQKGESPDLTRFLTDYERKSRQMSYHQQVADYNKTLAEVSQIDAHTDLIEQQKLTETQVTEIMKADAKFRYQYNDAQIAELRSQMQKNYSESRLAGDNAELAECELSLRHATVGLITQQQCFEFQLLVDSWQKLADDEAAWEQAKQTFVNDYQNAYFVSALQNMVNTADSQFWRDNPALASNWALLQKYGLPQMVETSWGVGPFKIHEYHTNTIWNTDIEGSANGGLTSPTGQQRPMY